MERKLESELRRWRGDPNRKTLLLVGCRQTGKTYSLTHFAESEYEVVFYVNFEFRPELRSVFASDLDTGGIVDRLVFEFGKQVVPRRTAIVLDEIQRCPEAYSALKPLSLERSVDVMASGSLLGVSFTEDDPISPLGYVDVIEMLPMDFEEFLWAMGISKEFTDGIRLAITERRPIDEYFLRRLNDLFRRFMVVGGMPEAVKAYAETGSYADVLKRHRDIITILESDVERYSGRVDKMKIGRCLKSIPRQLAREGDHRFRYQDIEKRDGAGSRYYGSALMWLSNAGMIGFCPNITEPVASLATRERPGSFKVYMADTGVLMTLMDDADAGAIVNRDPFANNGAVMENTVFCALRANGFTPRFYAKPDSTLEVDFVINTGDSVSVIEVKSGVNRKAKSLGVLKRTYKGIRAIKVSEGNVFTDENGIENYPLFAPCFFGRGVPDIRSDPSGIDEMERRFRDAGTVSGERDPGRRCAPSDNVYMHGG